MAPFEVSSGVLGNPSDSGNLSTVRLDLHTTVDLNGVGNEVPKAFTIILVDVAETIVLVDEKDVGPAADLDGSNILRERVLMRPGY